MDLQLQGKRALVTGSTRGDRSGIARRLGAEGVAVAIHGRDGARAEQVAREIRAAGGNAIVALGDLTDDGAANRVADAVEANWGGIDLMHPALGCGRKCRSVNHEYRSCGSRGVGVETTRQTAGF